jgi:hypothetical protein
MFFERVGVNRTFEEKYFQQPFYYIGKIEFDVLKSELILSVLSNTSSDEIEGTFTFKNISSYSGEFEVEEYDPMCIESLIGIDETASENEYGYCINFGVGEISLTCQSEAIVKWKNPDKCKIYLLKKETVAIKT